MKDTGNFSRALITSKTVFIKTVLQRTILIKNLLLSTPSIKILEAAFHHHKIVNSYTEKRFLLERGKLSIF
jgi:hypothetical protein